jgi:hypothetical protein
LVSLIGLGLLLDGAAESKAFKSRGLGFLLLCAGSGLFLGAGKEDPDLRQSMKDHDLGTREGKRERRET